VHNASNRATHPLAFPHPVNGKRTIFYSDFFYEQIVGLSAEEGRELCRELTGYITDPGVVYTHVWQPQDLVLWDNIKLQHARTDFDTKYRRHLRRTQLIAHDAAPGEAGVMLTQI
jgi:alpha-ketoglutarate-dependent taurine dioxygenase